VSLNSKTYVFSKTSVRLKEKWGTPGKPTPTLTPEVLKDTTNNTNDNKTSHE